MLVSPLNSGARVNALCREKSSKTTALHLAAITGDRTSLQLLIDNGANINATDANRSTPLHKAVEYQNLVAVQALLDAK